MKGRPTWEVLIGSSATLDHLAGLNPTTPLPPHPLQKLIEEFVATQLTDDEQELFYMRYGEQVSIRKIARALGYTSHQVIQVKLKRIEMKARLWLGTFT